MGTDRSNEGRGKRVVLWLLVALCAALLTACVDQDGPQDYINHQAGPYARDADRLWDLVFIVATAIFVIVEGLLLYAVIKFRHRPGRQAAQFHGNTKVEVVLTAIPALILAGIAVPTVSTIFDFAEERPNSLEITVTGRQFWWEYEYADSGVITANEMHIPIKTPVRLTIEGADVIHSFWVPRLAGKQDVVPGRVNYINLEADEPGTYLGQCTEFCGLSHANMRLTVIAHPKAEFAKWIADQQKPAVVDEGSPGAEAFFEGACVGCHAIGGTDAQSRTGPDLTHFASRETFAGALFENNTENLRRWLDDPPAVKPGSLMPDYNLSPEEIDALIEFLQSLE